MNHLSESVCSETQYSCFVTILVMLDPSVKVYVAKEFFLQNMGANLMPTLQQSFAWPIPFNFASMGDPTWYNSKDH